MNLRELKDLDNYDDIEKLIKLGYVNSDLLYKMDVSKKIIFFSFLILVMSSVLFPSDARGFIWGISFIVLLSCYCIFQRMKQLRILSKVDDICMARYGDTFKNSRLEVELDIKNFLEEMLKK